MLRLVATIASWVSYKEDQNICHKDSSNTRRSLTSVDHSLSALNQGQSNAVYRASKNNHNTLEHNFIIVVSDFATGTTAADIKSAIVYDSTDSKGYNCLLSCRLTPNGPS